MLQKLINHLKTTGMDIVEPFQVGWYNKTVSKEYQLPIFKDDNELGFLIGNTKKFWPYFLNHLKNNPQLLETENPLDDFVEKLIHESLKKLDIDSKVKFGHLQDPEYLKIQKLASLVGLAYLSDTRLSIHPTFGPWFSLRAVVIFPKTFEGSKGRETLNPCDNCETKCLLEAKKEKKNWMDWLAVRDACPLGKDYRFYKEQIEYHYTKNKMNLKFFLNET